MSREWLRGRLGRNSLPNVQNFSLYWAKGEVFPYIIHTERQHAGWLLPKIGKTSPCSDNLSQSLMSCNKCVWCRWSSFFLHLFKLTINLSIWLSDNIVVQLTFTLIMGCCIQPKAKSWCSQVIYKNYVAKWN